MEIVCRLPKLYPLKTHPDVFVRSLVKNLNKKFSHDLSTYVKDSHLFDCSILNIIEWIKENIGAYLTTHENGSATESSSNETTTDEVNNSSSAAASKLNEFSRMFIYSHHIFSLDKRREVMNIARDLQLTGFMMPGKPGVICVEGRSCDVDEFWTRLRGIQWQRLQIKVKNLLINSYLWFEIYFCKI